VAPPGLHRLGADVLLQHLLRGLELLAQAPLMSFTWRTTSQGRGTVQKRSSGTPRLSFVARPSWWEQQ